MVQIGAWSTGLLTAAGLKHLILPSITLAVFQLTLIMRLVRAEMLEVLRADYIKFARARGLPNSAVYFGHALKGLASTTTSARAIAMRLARLDPNADVICMQEVESDSLRSRSKRGTRSRRPTTLHRPSRGSPIVSTT